MTIVTRRTLLLPYHESFKLDFIKLNCCAQNRAEMNGPHTVSSALDLFERVTSGSDIYSMAVLDNGTRDYIGHLFISDLSSQPELGFIIDKAYWGEGIATEVLKAFFPKALKELGIDRVSATANTHHQASIQLLKKLGFEQTKTSKDLYGPYYEFEFTSDVVAVGSSAA